MILMPVALLSYATDTIEETLRMISENNPELRRSLIELQASQAENSTGLAPADPQVEVGYLWNSERGGGNRTDVSVTQELDFPTVYARRRAVSRASNSLAEARQRSTAVEVYRRARNLLIDLTYYNALTDIINQRLDYAATIANASREALAQGDITIIDFNKAAMDYTLCVGELKRIQLEEASLSAELAVMNGGTLLEFTNTEFPAANINYIDIDSLLRKAYASDLDVHRREQGVAAAEESLARSAWIPKFSLGYSSEFQNGNSLQGAVLGISIPLWENRNKVKAARLRALSAAMEMENTERSKLMEYQCTLLSINQLQEVERFYTNALEAYDSDALTLEAFNAGQITILEYANQMQYTQELRRNLLDTKRQLAKLYTRLLVPESFTE